MKKILAVMVLALIAPVCSSFAAGQKPVTDGAKIELKDSNGGKSVLLYSGTEEDFIKSVTADGSLSKICFIKRGRVFIMDVATKESKQYALGPQEKIMYYISAGISPDGKRAFGIAASLDGGAPNAMWIGELKAYGGEDEEYEGKPVMTTESFTEAAWKDNKLIEAVLVSGAKAAVDADKLKIISK